MTDGNVAEDYEDFCRERREAILDRIERAALRAGRDPSEVEAMAVSKTVGVEEVEIARRAGWRLFGENRPQELVRKTSALAEDPSFRDVAFDMIGNLQTNKVNQVIGRARLVHSISSAHLAETVSRRAEARGLVVPVLLEVNVSGEASKSGFSPEEAEAALDGLLGMGGIRVGGLMTMAPAHDADAARRTFAGLRDLAGHLGRNCPAPGLAVLSCGMSDDFEIAVEEGSTLVRLGRIAFDRDYRLS